MANKYNIIILLLILLIIIPCSFGFNTTLIDGTEYLPLETITLEIETTTAPEKGDPYTVKWYNSTGSLIETDTGFLSNIINGVVFENLITSSNTNWSNAYVNTTINAVTITRFFNVTGNSSNSLIITDTKFSPKAKLGSAFAVDFKVVNDENKEINNAKCEVFGTDTNGAPLQQCTVLGGLSTSTKGRGICSDILNSIVFVENEQYLAKIRCNCGIGIKGCFDSEGQTIEKHSGEASYIFEVTPWLSVDTITDKNNYTVDESIYMCANITNLENERVPLVLNYNWRCQNGEGDASTDRILLGNKIEERGISANSTQNQCTSFLIIDDDALEKGATNCYAATSVTVLDKNKKPIYTYDTTSALFSIIVDEINPFIRWNKIEDNIFSGKINLTEYEVGVKDIDVRVNNRMSTDNTPADYIKSYTVTYYNGSNIPYDSEIQAVATSITDNRIDRLEVNKFDEVTITILDVDTDLNESFIIEVILSGDNKNEGNKMIAIILIYFLLGGLYFFWGNLNQKNVKMDSTKVSTWLTILSYSMIFVKAIALSYLTYSFYTGEDVRQLLNFIFFTDLFILSGISLFTMLFAILGYFNPSFNDGKWEPRKW